MDLKFSELGLDPRLLSSVEKLGYQTCTPIQEAVLPAILEGRDISGLAQTGTGKTAAFLIPLMDRILQGKFLDWCPSHFILILVPTRELAEQVAENVEKLGGPCGLTGAAVYGGTGYEKQKEAFRQKVDFVVATPGRLIDLYKDHVVDLKQVRAVVFDEADRMFDMGFRDDAKYILQRISKDRQFLVFSATLNFDVLNTAYQFGAEPLEIDVSRDQTKAENVKDEIFHCGHDEKPAYLLSLLRKHNPRQVIVFSNFKSNVERIASFLTQNGIPAVGISSLLTQVQRNRVIALFKAENEKNILVATDVAARGLDIKGVDMIINYELPNDAESYVHRIGRTGRAGSEGTAFSLVCDRDIESLDRIQDYLKNKLNAVWLEEPDLVREFKPLPWEDLAPGQSLQENGGGTVGFSRREKNRERGPRGANKGGQHEPRSEQKRHHPHERQSKPHDSSAPQRKENSPSPQREKSLVKPAGTGSLPKRFTPSGSSGSGGSHGAHKKGATSSGAHEGGRRSRTFSQTKPAEVKSQKTVLNKISGFFKTLFGSSGSSPAVSGIKTTPGKMAPKALPSKRHHSKPKSQEGTDERTSRPRRFQRRNPSSPRR